MTPNQHDIGNMSPLAYAAIVGGVAGLLATIPMTLVMARLHSRLPLAQRYALPPRIVTDGIAERVPLPYWIVPRRGPGRALAAHFAFGAGTGALYGLLSTRPLKPGVRSGVAFGLGVWASSYLGWIPAAGLMPAATRQPRQRNAMMIAAHVVWGAALGATTAAATHLSSRNPTVRDAPKRKLL